MVRTEITLPGGAKARIEGTPQEVEDVVRRLTSTSRTSSKSTRAGGGTGALPPAGTISSYVLELDRDGFFSQARSLSEVREALASEGHMVPLTTLSGRMLSLVKQKRLRRLKSESLWKYVDR